VDLIDGWSNGYYSSASIQGDLKGFLEEDFQSHRWGRKTLRYEIPMEGLNGTHIVKLGFAELYKPSCALGKRIMNIFVNQKPYTSGLDVFEQAGCEGALVISKEIQLEGNVVDIFLNTTIQNPMLSLIEIEKIEGNHDASDGEEEPEAITCPCFDETALDTLEAFDNMEGDSDGLSRIWDSESGSPATLRVSDYSCPDETTLEEREYCRSLLLSSMHKYREIYPDAGVSAEECPCWPDGLSAILPDLEDDSYPIEWGVYIDYAHTNQGFARYGSLSIWVHDINPIVYVR